jgi:hypothetical protein
MAATTALASTAWPYVNGGDYHTTRGDYERKLRRSLWAVRGGEPVARDFLKSKQIAKEISVDPPDNVALRRYISQLVGRAVKDLPQEQAKDISLEAKREIVRITCEQLHANVLRGGPAIKEGQTDSLKYQVGLYSCESWWETNYKGEGRRIHERRSYWVPFIALKKVKE